jgi:hypothetical protein
MVLGVLTVMPKQFRVWASSCLSWYRGMPESIRIIMTAFIGAPIGYVTYLILYAINPLEPRATISWFIAFLINIGRQHGLHRWLTFDKPGPYGPSLRRAYVMYSGSAVATTILNWLLTVRYGINHNLAWLACVGLTGLISLGFLKRFVFRQRR